MVSDSSFQDPNDLNDFSPSESRSASAKDIDKQFKSLMHSKESYVDSERRLLTVS